MSGLWLYPRTSIWKPDAQRSISINLPIFWFQNGTVSQLKFLLFCSVPFDNQLNLSYIFFQFVIFAESVCNYLYSAVCLSLKFDVFYECRLYSVHCTTVPVLIYCILPFVWTLLPYSFSLFSVSILHLNINISPLLVLY